MNLKNITCALLAAVCLTAAAKELGPLDFITESALTGMDLAPMLKDINDTLYRCDEVFSAAEKMAAAEQKNDPQKADAVLKRLEIAKRLKNYIEVRRTGSREMQVLAWQGAQEMKALFEYFTLEKNYLDGRKALPAPVKISVADFGAKGDGQTDDGPAFRRAISRALEVKGAPVTIFIPAGNYYIAPEKTDASGFAVRKADFPQNCNDFYNFSSRELAVLAKTHLLILNADNLTIAGEKGSVLTFADAARLGIRIAGGNNVKVSGITLTYKEHTSTQGTIVKVENEPFALIFRPDAGYPAPDHPRFLQAHARRFTPSLPNGLYGDGTTRMGKVENLGDNTFRLKPQEHDAESLLWRSRKAGDRISIIARYDGINEDASAIDLRYCRFCTLENVTVWRSPGVSFRVFRNYALSMLGCRIEPAPGSKDLVTSNADGCQTTGMIGPYIANCYFSGMEDDGFNIHSSSPELNDVPAPDTTRPFLAQGGFMVSGVTGDVIAVLYPSPDGKQHYTRTVPQGFLSRKMVKSDLSGKEKESQNYFGERAYLFRNRPDRLVMIPGDLAGTVVTNCEFFNVRGMALQLTAANILVENCKVSHMNSYGINISALLPWGMTFNPHNVVIRNSTVNDTGNPNFSIRYRGLKGLCRPRLINDILIENCNAATRTWCAVENCNSSDVVIRNCRFDIMPADRTFENDPPRCGIYNDNSTDFIQENITTVWETGK